MSDKLLSLIIPVYNCDNYLFECLSSVFNQNDDSLEIVVVNDGSTDSSASIINSFKDKYSFILIEKTNGGISSARNVGLDNANGKYIGFLDSDDIWQPGIYSKIKSLLLSGKYDCCIFNYEILFENGSSRPVLINNKIKNCCSNSKKIKEMVADDSHWFVWRFIISARLYSEKKFDINRRFEDQLLLPLAFNESLNIFISEDSIVKYRQSSTSITKNLKLSDLEDSHFCIQRYVSFFRENSNRKYFSIVLSNLYISHISKCARISHCNIMESKRFYKMVNHIMPISAVFLSGNIKAMLYYTFGNFLYSRLKRAVEKEI